MHKKLLLLIACLGLALQLTSCTSKDSKQDSEAATDFESADLENLDGGSDVADSSLSAEQLPEDTMSEAPAPTADVAAADTMTEQPANDLALDTPPVEPTQDLAAAPTEPAPEMAPPVEPPAPEAPTMSSNEIMPPPAETETPNVAANEPVTEKPEMSAAATTDSKPVSAGASLQKVNPSPWQVGSVWANSVYFARPGDTMASVSKMIYGNESKVAELKKINPTLKSRSLKPGDKVYYNSPHRADDSQRMLTYYEDNGQQPEVYIAKKGDNLRKISKTLLGYDNAWKEVWASNSVESKAKLEEGTELKYWRGGAVAAANPSQEMGHNANQALPPEIPQQQPDVAMNPPMPEQSPMPEQMPAQAGADLPPPPPMPEQAPPPPPPADMAMNPPPPPPPMEQTPPPMPKHHDAEASGDMDSDTTMALAAVGIAAAGLAGLIVLRKKRKQKELEQALGQDTQVGT